MLILTLIILPIFLVLYLIRPARINRPGLSTGLWTGAISGSILLVCSILPVTREFTGALPSWESLQSGSLFHAVLGFLLLNLCLNLHWRRLKHELAITGLSAFLTSIIGPSLIALLLWVIGLIFSWPLSFPVALVLGWMLSFVDYRPLLNQRERKRFTSPMRLQLESHQLLSSIFMLSACLIMNDMNLGQLETDLQGLGIQLGMSITGGICIGLFFTYLAKEFMLHARQYELRWLTLITAYLLIMFLCESLGFSYIPGILILGVYIGTSLDHHATLKKDRQRLRQSQLLVVNIVSAFVLAWVMSQFLSLSWSFDLILIPLLLIMLTLLGRVASTASYLIPKIILKKVTWGQFFVYSLGPGPGVFPIILAILMAGSLNSLSQATLLGICTLVLGHLIIQWPLLPLLTRLFLPEPEEESVSSHETSELESSIQEGVEKQASHQAVIQEVEKETASDRIEHASESDTVDQSQDQDEAPLDLSLIESNNPGSSIFIESSQGFTEADEDAETVITKVEDLVDVPTDPKSLSSPSGPTISSESHEASEEMNSNESSEPLTPESDTEESAHPLIPLIRQERGDRNYDPYRLELKKDHAEPSAEINEGPASFTDDDDEPTDLFEDSPEDASIEMKSLGKVLEDDATMVWADVDQPAVTNPQNETDMNAEISNPLEAEQEEHLSSIEGFSQSVDIDQDEVPSNDELSTAMASLNEDKPDIFSPPTSIDLEALVEEEGSLNDDELAAFQEDSDALEHKYSGSPSAMLQDSDMIYDVDYEDAEEENLEPPDDEQSR